MVLVDNILVSFILSALSGVLTSLLIYIIRKLSGVERRLDVLEERISWIIKLMNSRDSE